MGTAATGTGVATHDLPRTIQIPYLRVVGGGLALLVLFAIVRMLVTNENMEWDVVWHYLFHEDILWGLVRTLQLTVIAMVIGVVLGALMALMRLSSNPVLSGVSLLYIWFFRGTPLLVQIIFWFNLSLLIPEISFSIPFGPELYHADTNDLITPFFCAVLALSLNEGAYMAEIVRAGILSIDPGQLEAAHTIGLSRRSTTRRIVLPQAMRVIIPPTGNQVIGMLKTTTLVSVIAMPELLYSAQLIYVQTYQTIPLLITVSIWYLVVSSIMTYIQGHIERHYSKGSRVPTSASYTTRTLRAIRASIGRRRVTNGTEAGR
ncbi:polar amino acid transport system permease protein [Nocardioides sp. J9]|uniref:amino acid ABC transporter permease n=1 Tax=Nocardioides sp. J9 TaxID=935844 RepID=UPI0011A889F6|nr:amino acid ABC transporter permease [Nocardioides sp. J9]TWH01729.1 polar amino acid transport system permease protein [Nocardioides sp. J9]